MEALGQVMHLGRPSEQHHQQRKTEQRRKVPLHAKLVEDVRNGASWTWSRVQHCVELEQRHTWNGRHAQFASISGALGNEVGSSRGTAAAGVASKGAVQTAKEPGLSGLRESLDESGAVEKPEWTSEQQKRGREGRFLIHEVQILDSEGNDLEMDHPELKSLIQKTMKISNRPGFAFNVKEVHEDIDRLGRLGVFENVVPYTKDTRDGVVLQLHVSHWLCSLQYRLHRGMDEGKISAGVGAPHCLCIRKFSKIWEESCTECKLLETCLRQPDIHFTK